MESRILSIKWCILASLAMILMFPSCTIVNYCIGTKIDENKQERNIYKKGERFALRKNRPIHILTVRGEAITGICLEVVDESWAQGIDLVADRDTINEAYAFIPGPGNPSDEQKHGRVLRILTNEGIIREVGLEEVYYAKTEYRRKSFWSKALLVPGLAFDAALILSIQGIIPLGLTGRAADD